MSSSCQPKQFSQKVPANRKTNSNGQHYQTNCKSHLRSVHTLDAERPKLSDPAHRTHGLQPRRSRRVRCSAWLGCVRDLIHTPQKYIRVTEIREDTNSSLSGQSCRSTPRANANERNANTATGTSIPNSVAHIYDAGK